jgi:tetratricopeptide (TPR) repeat protein
MLLFCYDWNWAAAEKAFKRGIDLNPAYPPAHYWYGYCLIALGRLQEGEAQMRKGQQLEPLSMIAATFAGFPLYFSRRLDEAIRHFQPAIEMDPNFAVSHVFLGEALYAAGRIREAVELPSGRRRSAMRHSFWGRWDVSTALRALGNKPSRYWSAYRRVRMSPRTQSPRYIWAWATSTPRSTGSTRPSSSTRCG